MQLADGNAFFILRQTSSRLVLLGTKGIIECAKAGEKSDEIHRSLTECNFVEAVTKRGGILRDRQATVSVIIILGLWVSPGVVSVFFNKTRGAGGRYSMAWKMHKRLMMLTWRSWIHTRLRSGDNLTQRQVGGRLLWPKEQTYVSRL